jgi:hypothetical protein
MEEKPSGREARMSRLYLLVEGQTEETFVRELLTPHYARMGLYITPIIVSTSPGHKGGVVSYGKIKPQISRLCKQDDHASVSTLFDLYALPGNFPGKATDTYPTQGTGEQKAVFLEAQLALDINETNFIPNLMVHEFEALLFVKPEAFRDWTDSQKLVDSLTAIVMAYETPEHINDGPQTAPSKRIAKLMPEYEKTFHGPLIAAEIGLDSLRQACPHFNNWLLRLEQLAA